MPRILKYNVYDNGKMVLEDATAKEVCKYLESDNLRVAWYASEEKVYKDRYAIEKHEPEEKVDTVEEIAFKVRWEETVKLFRNVIWVKQGGKRLHVSR